MDAYRVCDELKLIRPVVEQPQYNLLVRDKLEVEFARIFENYKMGTTGFYIK